MRLNPVQVDMLKQIAAEVFGPQAGLTLFGSRADDTRRGGDIDLYVTGVNEPLGKLLDEKLLFLVKAKRALGDQRIDLVFAPAPHEPYLPIHRAAERTGMAL
jgi:predicted nucleotidyltransferase